MANEKLCFKDYISCPDDKKLSKTRRKMNAKSHKKRVYGLDWSVSGPMNLSGAPDGGAAIGESDSVGMHNGNIPGTFTADTLGGVQAGTRGNDDMKKENKRNAPSNRMRLSQWLNYRTRAEDEEWDVNVSSMGKKGEGFKTEGRFVIESPFGKQYSYDPIRDADKIAKIKERIMSGESNFRIVQDISTGFENEEEYDDYDEELDDEELDDEELDDEDTDEFSDEGIDDEEDYEDFEDTFDDEDEDYDLDDEEDPDVEELDFNDDDRPEHDLDREFQSDYDDEDEMDDEEYDDEFGDTADMMVDRIGDEDEPEDDFDEEPMDDEELDTDEYDDTTSMMMDRIGSDDEPEDDEFADEEIDDDEQSYNPDDEMEDDEFADTADKMVDSISDEVIDDIDDVTGSVSKWWREQVVRKSAPTDDYEEEAEAVKAVQPVKPIGGFGGGAGGATQEVPKIDKARQIFPQLVQQDMTRSDIIASFVNDLDVTQSTAVSYYEKIAKEMGMTGEEDQMAGGMGGPAAPEPNQMQQPMDQMPPETDMVNDTEELATSGDPDRQGIIRTVDNAHLVYKRQTEDGTFEELWVYNIGTGVRDELKVRRAILAGTDIPQNKTQSEDGSQGYTLQTMGNAQMLHISGLPN